MSLSGLYNDLSSALQTLDATGEYVAKTEVIGTKAIVRAPQLDLAQAIKDAQKVAGSKTLYGFEVYADTLTALSDIVLPNTCLSLLIVARRAFVGQTNPVTLVVNPKSRLGISLVKDGEPVTIPFRFTVGRNAPVDQLVVVEPNVRGKYIVVNSSSQVTVQNNMQPLLGNFNYMTAAEAIEDNGQFKALGFDESNDHLPKLLDFQLLLAARTQTDMPKLTYDVASFVVKVTADIPKALDYNSQASTILGAYYMNSDNTIGQYLSPLNIDLAKEVLSSRLLAASNFEASYKDFMLQEATSANIQTLAQTALDNALTAQSTYDFLSDQAQENYESAEAALIVAQDNFQKLQMQLDGKQKAFQDGIEAWKKKMIVTAVFESVAAVALIAGSIAVAVVAPPAGAAIATGSAAELTVAVKTGADVAQNLALIVELINQLKDLFKKMKPGLEKIDKLISAIKTILELMKKFKRVDTANTDLANLPQIGSDDMINGIADWDAFASDMSFLWGLLSDEKIAGSREFFSLLQEMAIRAKAVYSAQYAVTVMGQTYTAALVRGLENQNETKRLQAAVTQIANNQNNCRIFKLALLDRLLRVRSFVNFDFQDYVRAYAFYALDMQPPILLDPLKDMDEFLTDAAMLQKKVARAKATINAQKRKFTISNTDTSQTMKLNPDWQESLNQQRIMTMNILPGSPLFAQRGRIRIVKFSLFLEGAKIGMGSDAIRVTINFGRDLQDLSLTSPQQVMNFAGAETKAGFEYASKTDIMMEGQLMYPQNAVAITPFTTWMVSVDKATDCSAVSGVTLELECEVTNLS